MAANNRIDFQVRYNVDQASINSLKKSLQDIQKIKIGDFNGSASELAKIQLTALKVGIALQNAFNVNLGSLNAIEFTKQLQSILGGLQGVHSQFAKLGAQGLIAFNNMASSVLTTNLQLKLTHSLINSMGLTMANTVKWGIASSIMNQFTGAVKNAFSYVQSLDSALTDIRIVTGDSTLQMKQFAVEANNAAQSLGRSTMDYTKAALTFYQQGLDDQTVQARTEATLKAQNITGAGDLMADYLTAVWNGYRVANEEALLYVDKLAAVADSSASNMSLLAVAMSKVASTARAMGVDVDSLNAQIATIVGTTRQAPESVGNALKTIYARINDIATGADDALVSLGNYSLKMAQVGFSVLDANGNLRDTGLVIDLIGGKWLTLSRLQQIYLARTMAGQRQYNNLIALFDNWGRYTDLVNVSLDSQGTLMLKNNRYMDSLEAKMLQLGAAGERFKSALINELDLKSLTLFGTNAVNVFASLILSIGGGRGALLNFGSIFASLFSGTISKEINNIITNIQNAKNNAEILKADIENTQTFKIAAPDSKAIDVITTKLSLIQKYYSVMDLASINTQKNLIDELGQILNTKTAILGKQKVLLLYAARVGATDTKRIWELETNLIHLVLDAIENLSGSSVDLRLLYNNFRDTGLVTDQFKNTFNEFLNSYEQLNPDKVERLKQIWSDIQRDGTTNGSFTTVINNAINLAIQKTNEFTNVLSNSKQEYVNLNNLATKLSNTIDSNTQKAKQLFDVTNVVKFTTSLGRVAAGFNNLINLGNIWSNQNLSFGQKILQTLTNLTMTIPMMISGFKQMGSILGLLAITQLVILNTVKKHRIEELKITLQKKLQASYQNGTAFFDAPKISKQINDLENESRNLGSTFGEVFTKNLNTLKDNATKTFKAIGSGLVKWFTNPVTAIPTLVAAAAVAVGVILYNAYKKAERAAKEAALAAEQAKNIYKQTSEECKNLASALLQLKSAKLTFDGLTKGTTLWKNALEDVNAQVLELIQQYPELRKYLSVDQNGLMSISLTGQEEVQNIYRQKNQSATLAYLGAEQRSNLAANFSRITDVSRLLDGILGVTPLDLLRVVNAINQHGMQLLYNKNSLMDLAKITEKDANVIIAHSTEVVDLANEIKSNNIATENLSEALIKSSLVGVQQYLNSSNQDAFAKLFDKALSDATLNMSKYYTETEGGYMVNSLKVAKRYTDILGTEVKTTFLGDYKYKDLSGNLQKISAKDVEAAVAYQDAIEDVSKIYDLIVNQMDDIENTFGLNLSNIVYNLITSGFNKLDITKITFDLLAELAKFENTKLIAKLLGVSEELVQKYLFQYTNDLSENVLSHFKSLSRNVQTAFSKVFSNKGGVRSYSLLVQEYVGNLLTEGLKKGGSKGLLLIQDVFNSVNALDFESLSNIISNIDFSNITVDSFKLQLRAAGIELDDINNNKLQSFINLLKEFPEAVNPELAYKNIHDIINGLEIGDTIDALQQAAALEAAGIELDNYFTHMADGTLKLQGDAEKFYNYANNISLLNFYKLIERLQLANALLSNWNQNSYSALQGGSFNNLSSIAGAANTLLQTAQIQFLQFVDSQNLALQDAFVTLEKELSLSIEQRQALSLAVKLYQLAWENTNSVISENNERVRILQELINNASLKVKLLDPDVDTASYEDLSNYIHQYARDILYVNELTGLLQNVSLELLAQKEAAEDLAEAILRYDHALQEVQLHYDNWLAKLTSNSVQLQILASNELKNVYSDLLDLPFENLSSVFTQNINNLHDLKLAAEGDILAYNRLKEAAQADIEAYVGIRLDDTEFYNQKDLFLNYLDSINFDDIEIGATIDDAQAIAEMNDLINAAHMTADQATDYLASMGIDAEIKENAALSTGTKTYVDAIPQIRYNSISVPRIVRDLSGITSIDNDRVLVPLIYYLPRTVLTPYTDRTIAPTLKVTSAKKSSGGGFKFQQASHGAGSAGRAARAPKTSSSRGGGSGSAKKPTVAKLTETKNTSSERKLRVRNPYLQVLKAYLRQELLLDNILKKLKLLVDRDRVKLLEEEAKELEKQNKIIDERLKISESVDPVAWMTDPKTTALYRKWLQKNLNAGFDDDGRLANRVAAENTAIKKYNDALNKADARYNKLADSYNKWITNVYNKASADRQLQLKAQKDLKDAQLKDAEERWKNLKKQAEDNYKQSIDNLNNYQKAWLDDQKSRLTKILNELKKYLDLIEALKLRIDLKIDAGDFEREWLDFENKFIKKLSDDDIVGNAKASVKLIFSYFNSGQIQAAQDYINTLQQEIAKMLNGLTSSVYGTNLAQAKEDLEQYMKQQMDDLLKVQDLVDDIKDSYLDAIDEANDKMKDQVDQYERINSLIDHDVKLLELLYGDKAYDTREKYYDLQKKNNLQELESLRQQQQFWQDRMNQLVVGSDAWKKFKDNLDSVTDDLNSKLELMIQNLSDQWLNRVDGIIEKLNNSLTSGLGTDYLDEQWDYINDYDDKFLDTFNSTVGVQEVENLYNQAIEGLAGNPKAQQRINNLMKDQLKILKEKDVLTEYDLERAKAMLQVEQARMDLEDARNNKTKMRLRRDSQGNYTYQYVADEEQLGELEQALADAQANLYNTDKDHYKQNLNDLYDTYKDYLSKMKDLTAEYNATQDELERARIQNRIDLLKESQLKMMQGLLEDNDYLLKQYLTQSYFDGMGIDTANMSLEEMIQALRENVPQAASAIQDLGDSIRNQGGLLSATADAVDQINQATEDHDKAIKEQLETAGTSLLTISNVTDDMGQALDSNITAAQNLLTTNLMLIESCRKLIEAMQDLLSMLDLYLNKAMNVELIVANLRSAYNIGQILNGSSLTADEIPVSYDDIDTTFTDEGIAKAYYDYLKSNFYETFDLESPEEDLDNAIKEFVDSLKLNDLIKGVDIESVIRAADVVQGLTSALGNYFNTEVESFGAGLNGILGNLNTNETLDQNVHIDASFPNASNAAEIEAAFNNLINMASMYASKNKD